MIPQVQFVGPGEAVELGSTPQCARVHLQPCDLLKFACRLQSQQGASGLEKLGAYKLLL